MLKVGLTGGIGSGKSYVANYFKKLGIPVYNADKRAKILMLQNGVKHQIIALFGEKAYLNDELNRSYISSIVFEHKDKLEMLNSIVHPAVRQDFLMWHKAQKAAYSLREAAILIESGAHKDCDKIICVSCPEKIRIERVMSRDEVNKEEVQRRINNQLSDKERESMSDFIICNDGVQDVENQVNNIHKELLSLS